MHIMHIMHINIDQSRRSNQFVGASLTGRGTWGQYGAASAGSSRDRRPGRTVAVDAEHNGEERVAGIPQTWHLELRCCCK